jgi:quercetin dioxygenase-like cupin family protein
MVAMHTVLGLLLAFVSTLSQPPAALRGNVVVPIVDNERVTVWDITWTKGAPSPLPRRGDDYVVLYLTNGRMKLTRPDGGSITLPAGVGDVVFQPKGTVKTEESALDEPVRARVIDLHDHYVAPLKNTSGYPKAFPRPGSKKLLDNARVVVWDYTFTSGSPSPMHFHDKDVVVTYLADGALTSTTPDGQSQTNEVTFGLTKFNPRSRTHTEQLVRGKSRVIAVELK